MAEVTSIELAALFVDAVLELRRQRLGDALPLPFSDCHRGNGDTLTKALTVWAACAALPVENPLHIAPFYDAPETRGLLSEIIEHLEGLPYKERDDGNNIVLQGVVGVGKTTFLRVTAVVCAVLFPQYLPVYWTYEDFKTEAPPRASDVLRSVASAAAAGSSVRGVQGGPFASGSVVKGTGLPAGPVVLLLDEINTVYDCTDIEAARSVINELVALGKAAQFFAVVAGSSSQLSDRVFPAADSEWARRGFRTLNDSVFVLHHVYPIRTVEGVEAYLRCRFPNLVDDAANVFRMTGGVGRAIARYTRSPLVENTQRRKIRKMLAKDHHLNRLMLRFAVSSVVALHLSDAIDASGTVDETDAEKRARLWRWENDSIIVTLVDTVEVLVPFYTEVVKEDLDAEEVALQLRGLFVTLWGWDGYGSAGAAAEEVFKPSVCEDVLGASYFGVDKLSFVGDAPTTGGRALSWDDITTRCFKLSVDKGADIVRVNPDGDVSGVQVKTGARGTIITAGKPETQRANVAAKKDTDGSLASIVARGERSLKTFIDHLRLSFPDKMFHARAFYLWTTKELNDAALTKYDTDDFKLRVGNEQPFALTIAATGKDAIRVLPVRFQKLF